LRFASRSLEALVLSLAEHANPRTCCQDCLKRGLPLASTPLSRVTGDAMGLSPFARGLAFTAEDCGAALAKSPNEAVYKCVPECYQCGSVDPIGRIRDPAEEICRLGES